MVTFLKGRRKTDEAVVAVDSSGAHITVALETLVARAVTALEQLRAMSGVLDRTAEIDALRERCETVERQVAGMEELMAQVSQAEGQLQRVSQSGEQLDQIQIRMGELGGKGGARAGSSSTRSRSAWVSWAGRWRPRSLCATTPRSSSASRVRSTRPGAMPTRFAHSLTSSVSR